MTAWNSLLLALNLVLFSTATAIAVPPSVKDPTATANQTVVVPTKVVQTQTPNPPKKEPIIEYEGTTLPQPDKTKPTSTPTPAEISRQQKMIAADRLYLGGQFAAAEKLYREVKAPFATTAVTPKRRAIVDPAQLPPAGKVYWREAEAAFGGKLQTKVMIPLRFLVEQYPEFIPGHLKLAQALEKYDYDKEALDVLERATTLYPEQPELVKAKVGELAKAKKWMEASLAARQFALINADKSNIVEFTQLAEENLERYKKHMRSELRGSAIANVITGALGYALTGNLLGPFSAVQTTTMLLRGESVVGESVADQARDQLEIVTDKAVVDYINEIGRKLAQVAGRDDFKYEFYIVLDDDLNAFALPGGKVFVNAGAIAHTKSEAELAGLIAHELSHAVLSHGFQLVAEGNLVANVTQFVPYGGTVANLVASNYSRDMEQQADKLGTRLLASTGYAADGLRNLMVTLKQQEKIPFTWFAAHPPTNSRIQYLETLIQRNGYNRYAYEGVARHAEIKKRVEKLLAAQKQTRKKKHQR